jgi:hypothetical protein
MDGDDYVRVEESQRENIFQAYIDSLNYEDIPEEFVYKWVSSYLEGANEDEYDKWRDEQDG